MIYERWRTKQRIGGWGLGARGCRSSVFSSQFSVADPQSAGGDRPSAVGGQPSAVDGHPSAVDRRRSSFVFRPSSIVVLIAMLLFVAWFSAYSIRLHDAHRTHKADLGQIDLAIWNTAHGRFVQEIKDDQVSTRLTDHVEPIFLLVAPVFWLWNDARALLILQAVALAAGAWPIYLLARRKIAEGRGKEEGRRKKEEGRDRREEGRRKKEEGAASASSFFPLPSSFADWAAVVFALAYLFAPALQAAAVAEFHALALAPIFVAWALWAVESRRWVQFAVAVALLMCVQEGMALLAVMLGFYAVVKAGWGRSPNAARSKGRSDASTGSAPVLTSEFLGSRVEGWGVYIGAAVVLIGLAWFYATTFIIIPHYAAQAYGVAETPYAARYGELGASFGDVLKSLVTRPWVALRIAAEPARVSYLIGLLAPTGFLALLDPEMLLLGLPLLLANLFSSFPMQYFGELHYSAPLVPYFIAAGVIGLRRFREQVQPVIGARAAILAGLAIVAAGALTSQVLGGYTFVGREYRLLGPGWPQVTAHDRLLARFAAQIPPDAPLSATADLYPHLSHRPLIYQFPWLGQAEWALVDVSGTTDRHPADIQRAIVQLLGQGWGVVDAADGYVLLGKGRGAAALPDAFYSFARAAAARPEHALDITFGGRVKLVGYDLVDNPKWRSTAVRFYWQALAPLSDDVTVRIQFVSAAGAVVADSVDQPAPALLWYPPARWRPGEATVVETLPMYLPQAWTPSITVDAGGQPLAPQVSGDQARVTSDGHAVLAPWERKNGWLAPFGEPREKYPLAARFSDGDWTVRLTDIAMRLAAAPGRSFPIMLRWAADVGPAPHDYRIFVHLRDAAGQTVANGDATPTWFAPLPVNQWPSGFATWGAHALPIPADLAPGEYTVVIGWYDPETGARLSASSADGNAQGNEYVLGKVVVNPLAGPRPDLACLMVPESCASQE